MGDGEVTEWACFTHAYSGPVCNLTWDLELFYFLFLCAIDRNYTQFVRNSHI